VGLKRGIRFELIENARDSLRQAVHTVAEQEFRGSVGFKRVIVNLAHAVELMLKERLRRIHPAFVWEKVDQYPSLDARTVSVVGALRRLENIGDVSFSAEDKKAVGSTRIMRNAIEHYEYTLDVAEAKRATGRTLSFLFSFCQRELSLDLESEFRGDGTWQCLIDEFGEFVEPYARGVTEQLDEAERPYAGCPVCGHETVDLMLETCLVCGHLMTEDEWDHSEVD
jgi:hypothetical protein